MIGGGGEEAGMRGCEAADYLHFAWKIFFMRA